MTFTVQTGGELIEGLVLCRVGDDRLAVRASEVTAFEPPAPGVPYAGAAFSAAAPPPAQPRVLRAGPALLAVDSVEVFADRVPLLGVPPVLRTTWGGAVTGFVEAQGQLWPLVSLPRLQAEGGPTW